MYYVRKYKSGAGDHDPRQIYWAVFHCDVCGEDSDINVTSTIQTFDFGRVRKCPSCKSVGKGDYLRNLKVKKEELFDKRITLQIEIDRVCAEIEELESKSATQDEIERVCAEVEASEPVESGETVGHTT